MVVRLAKVLGSTTETWIRLQAAYDVAQAHAGEGEIDVVSPARAGSARRCASVRTKVLGCGTRRDRCGTNPGVCCGFARRRGPTAEALGQHVDPVLRRANLLISGVDLENSRGNMLRVGSGRLRVNGETRPCERMDEPLPGLRAERRHRWGGGVYASVLEDGKIAVGDPVEGERAAPRKPEQSLSRRSPPPRRRRAGSRGLRPRRFHRPIPRAHPHPQVPGSGLSRGSLPGHASRGCLHGRRPERLGERHGDRGYVLHQTCSRTPSGHQPSELLEQRGV